MTKTARPVAPLLVLASAFVLPGTGQVLNREPVRGLMFLFFILLLGGFTLKTAAPDVSALGKYSGGVFVWAMSMFDAYKRALACDSTKKPITSPAMGSIPTGPCRAGVAVTVRAAPPVSATASAAARGLLS